MHEAFVASADLKPMARQLLQDRTPAAYAGVELYARKHAGTDAGALAWLVLGYAHSTDRDFAKAIDPLTRAKPHAGDLGDYVAYYLGNAYVQTGRSAEAIAALGNFDREFPKSLLIRDVHVTAATAMLQEGRVAEAIGLLERDRTPVRADQELGLGRAYEADGQTAKAIEIFNTIYYTMPLSGEADAANGELQKMSGQLPPAGVNLRRSRADLLLKGKRYDEAGAEYRALLGVSSPADRPAIELALGTALRRGGRLREAKQTLESIPGASPEENAERLFNLGEIARSQNDDDGFLNILGQLRQASPTSPWFEQALLAAGNVELIRRDYDRAIDFYRELEERFPNGSRASYAMWKVSWLSLRQGRFEQAKTGFEKQIGVYPASAEVPQALYWRGRLAEEDGDLAMARAYYQKLSERFLHYYYGELARRRLKDLKAGGAEVHYALLDRVPALGPTRIPDDDPPADDLRVQKAHLLENGALLDFAIRELRAAASEDKGSWLAPEIARMYRDIGRYDLAVQVMKREVPNYFAVELPVLPRSYWEALFPKAYWSDLKRYSESNELDPYLVASLIRQESEFNPNAVSHANAVGLMQLLPKTGKKVAKEEKMKHFNSQQLFSPSINLQLGTKYFRSMVDQFGSVEYALAAYNAGADRVQDWLGQGKYRDVQEFVESIPFTETREYVQAIVRNADVYRQLYGAPEGGSGGAGSAAARR
jgi:soluble lytic murein transglycosylase